MAIFLGANKIKEVTKSLKLPAETPVAVVFHASWPDQMVLVGNIQNIADKVEQAGIDHSALILVGNVVGRTGFRRSHLYRDR
jgi:precorrin-4/cobalt-precorrin-4 C11-methyltransferase